MSASFPYMPLFCSRYTPMVKQRSSYTLQVLGRSRVGPTFLYDTCGTFTMGGHHKKQLRAEKAKVKLKGAKLPKGLNVTKTEFKVRKIQIREQLSQTQYLEGQRQVNLKEILSRLKHHGSNFRLEALRNLRDAILSGHNSIPQRMHDIIQGISSLSLDIEREPRRESFNTLKKLLSTLTVEEVAPFFHVISSYLRCAMTHIQPTIQEDSLLMLDVLLEHVPQLVAEQSGKIFNDFLQMISRVRAEGESNRTLTVNMGQKQTTIKWRTKVLQRLQLMLRKQYETQQILCGAGTNVPTFQMHTFNVKASQHFALKRSYGVNDISELFSLNTANVSKSLSYADDPTSLRFCMEHLMPLLLEAWLEVRPQEHKNANRNMAMGAQLLLSNDAALTLKAVLDIIENLWALIDLHETNTHSNEVSSWFKKEYAEAFATNFLHLNAFPYQQSDYKCSSELNRKAKKPTISIGEEHCLHQNITLVYLMCRFFGERNEKKSWKYFNVLVEYLQTIVGSLKEYPVDQQGILVLALRAQLLQSGQCLLQILPEKLRELLRFTINAFLQQEFCGKAHSSMLITLCDIVQKPDLVNSYGKKEFHKFLKFLPQLLLNSTIAQDAILSMCTLGKQQNLQFLQALAPLTTEVIENITKIQVHGAANAFEGKKHIMNLFYWIDRPTNSEELCEKITLNISDKRIVSYFKFVLTKHVL